MVYYFHPAICWSHSLKVEAIHYEKFFTRAEAKQDVFEYIEVYYNRKRLHPQLGYISPKAFEAKMGSLSKVSVKSGQDHFKFSSFRGPSPLRFTLKDRF
jgi:hypothetical protein